MQAEKLHPLDKEDSATEFSRMRRNILCLLPFSLLKPSAVLAQALNVNEYQATVSVVSNASKRAINLNVLGACLMYPPFEALNAHLSKWRGRSVRVWSHLDRKWWDQLLPALHQLDPETLLFFNEASWHPVHVIYKDAKENNLSANQQPAAVIDQMKIVLTLITEAGLHNKKLYWETWNEPQFTQTGSWAADDMARYVNDIAQMAQKEGLPFGVLAPLHMDPSAEGKNWNESLCQRLDTSSVSGLVNHYYNLGWFALSQPQDEFLRRAGDGVVLRERVKLDRKLVEQYGKGKWTLHCSEWNVHPRTYEPPYNVSRDMAAALYAFSAVKVYLEEGVDSAQFFLLASGDSHFAAYTVNGMDVKSQPTGLMMEWLGEHLRGSLLQTEVISPSYKRSSEYDLPDFDVPYLEAMATASGSVVQCILANKDPLRSCSVLLKGTLGMLTKAKLVLLEADGFYRLRKFLAASTITFEIPPATVAAIYFEESQ